MLAHIVLFNFKSEISDPEKERILALSREKLAKLPGVQNLLVGKTIKQDSEFEYALTMYFDDVKALDHYRDHPDHVHFRDKELFPFLDKVKGLDYAD